MTSRILEKREILNPQNFKLVFVDKVKFFREMTSQSAERNACDFVVGIGNDKRSIVVFHFANFEKFVQKFRRNEFSERAAPHLSVGSFAEISKPLCPVSFDKLSQFVHFLSAEVAFVIFKNNAPDASFFSRAFKYAEAASLDCVGQILDFHVKTKVRFV